MMGCTLRVVSWRLRVAGCGLHVASCGLRVAGCVVWGQSGIGQRA